MRIIDFLQFISDLDKQTQFFYQNTNNEIEPISDLKILDDQVLLYTKKAKSQGLHQWELLTLLNPIKTKTNFIKVVQNSETTNIYGIQLHNRKVYLK